MSPSAMISTVSMLTNLSAVIEKEMVMPSSSVTSWARLFCAVSESRSRQPHSRMRLPNIKNPTSETEAGATMPATIVTKTGNRIRVSLLTLLGL